MKDILKQYIDRQISRRSFLSYLGGLGISLTTANSLAQEFAPFQKGKAEPSVEALPSWMQYKNGTGGELLVAQLKAAGIEYIFANPSSGAGAIFDALVDEPNMHVIKGLHEGALAAMADGYAKATGKTPFVLVARPGLPNCMTQMYNAWKDNIPMVVAVDDLGNNSRGQDGFEEIEDMQMMTQPITKWHWTVESTNKIPEITRRAIKFAGTQPCGPVFINYPADTLYKPGAAAIMDQAKFTIQTAVRPDADQVKRVASMLMNASNPLLYAGDEVTWAGAQDELLELAELLSLPVVQGDAMIPLSWSKPFPTRHPLFLGGYQETLRYPGKVDVLLNLGSAMPLTFAKLRMAPSIKLIQVRMDTSNLARLYPTELAIVADPKLTLIDLLATIKNMASSREIARLRKTRLTKTKAYTSKMSKHRQSIARKRHNNSPISIERLAEEMEKGLEKDTCIVAEVDSGAWALNNLMFYGGKEKQFFSNAGLALGWGLPAAFGIKLALPDRPVVAILGDGAFLFSGPQPLWSFARYHAPVTVIVMNNRSYNAERNRIWTEGGRQFETGRDMVCYIGTPDIDYVKLAEAFDVKGEVVTEPGSIKDALNRAKSANADGLPYLLDVHIERRGIGALSTWHPPYSIKALRKRKV